jgi:hypothetical protein
MGNCGGLCHKYQSVVINRKRVITHKDGKVEKIYETTHQRDILDIENNMIIEDMND